MIAVFKKTHFSLIIKKLIYIFAVINSKKNDYEIGSRNNKQML
jgi:hypothetical protein